MRAFRYDLPLTKPIKLRGSSHSVREGVLLKSEVGWGDAAPLPGFSRESLQDVLRAWRAGPPFALPSLQFAYDSASRPLTAGAVPLNALLAGSTRQILARARQIARSKCSTIKLKIGRRGDLESDAELVWQVRRRLRADQHLCLDANRAWDESSAIAFGQRLAGCDIEYIEEPLADPTNLEAFYRQTTIPYALDETLTEQPTLARFPSAAAFVCKPTMLGSRERMEELVATGKPLVFSASFESGVGIARIAQWAAEFAPHVPAGLDTYSWLAHDVLTRRLEMTAWVLRLPHDLEVNRSLLVEI